MKKGDMAAAAEGLVEGKGWLPTVLRTASAEPELDGEGEPMTADGYSFAAE